MPLPRVTGVVWWKMSVSHYKAIFRRAEANQVQGGYTKDFLQAPQSISNILEEMFHGDPPYEPLIYRWPGGQFGGGRVYPAADYGVNGRLEVGQWTQAGAPHPWRVGDPSVDPLICLPGDPDADIPDDANSQWPQILALEPWLMLVQLDHSQTELHLRAYLAAPPNELTDFDLNNVPGAIRQRMTGQGGIASGLQQLAPLWFDTDDLHDPWRDRDDPTREPNRARNLGQGGQAPLGDAYQHANENVSTTAPDPFTVDPDARDRATRAHARTQNALAGVVEARGLVPLSPSGEPHYDLAWHEPDGTVVVAEVKSVNARNEERQLRLGLGQVLRYRHLTGGRALLALSQAPSDPRWQTLCQDLGVGLVWLPDLGNRLAAWIGY